MTSPIVGDIVRAPSSYVDPTTPCKDGQLAVVDERGALVGMVEQSALLAEYRRDDHGIHDDVERRVLIEEFSIEQGAIDVDVADGVVTLTGQLENHRVADHVVDEVSAVPGVVDVQARLTWPPDPHSGTVPRSAVYY